MKGKIFAVLAIGTIAIASCKKVEPTPAKDPGTATIKGTLWANLDTWNDTNQSGGYQLKSEYVPAGTKVTVIVDSYDLDQTPDPSYNYQDLKYTGVIGTSGDYSIANVPCFNTPIDVEVYFNDFSFNKVWGPLAGDYTSTVYTMGSVWLTIYDGAIVIHDATYAG